MGRTDSNRRAALGAIPSQLDGEGDDRDPDPVAGEAVRGQVGQPGGLRAADTVLGAGPAAVA